MDETLIENDDGATQIFNACHNSDALAVLYDTFADFNNLVSPLCGECEPLSFEKRFAPLISKFNSHGCNNSLPEPLTAFLLVESSQVEDNQRIYIPATAAKKLSYSTSSTNSTQYTVYDTSSAEATANTTGNA